MAIEEKTYPMCNYNTSKIIVALRDTSVVMDAGRRDAPSVYPFTLSELVHINNTSTIIKSGYLVPADDVKEFVYTTLRIMDWKDILSAEEIEDIILHPTVSGLNTLIHITDSLYFNRVYGTFIGLKNVNAPISANVTRLIKGRYKEIQSGKITTEFIVSEKDVASADTFLKNNKKDDTQEVQSLKDEIAALKEQMAQMIAAASKPETISTPYTSAKKTTSTRKPKKKEA